MTEDYRAVVNRLGERLTPKLDAPCNIEIIFDEQPPFCLELRPDGFTVREGQCPAPTVILTTSVETLERIIAGELKPQAAVVQGKLEVAGDLGWIARLEGMLSGE